MDDAPNIDGRKMWETGILKTRETCYACAVRCKRVIDIPGKVLTWWDVQTNELKRIKMPGLALQVIGSPIRESGSAEQLEYQHKKLVLWLVFMVVTTAMVLLLFLRKQIIDYWAAFRKARSNSEAMYFRRVMKSAQSGNPKVTLHETLRWLDRINDDRQPARLDLFLSRYGDAQTQEAAIRLTEYLESNSEKLDISAFLSGLASARNRWRQEQHAKRQAIMLLPELNGSRQI